MFLRDLRTGEKLAGSLIFTATGTVKIPSETRRESHEGLGPGPCLQELTSAPELLRGSQPQAGYPCPRLPVPAQHLIFTLPFPGARQLQQLEDQHLFSSNQIAGNVLEDIEE